MNKPLSFEAIYSSYWSKVFRLCMGYLNDGPQAQDACQEIFIKVWQQLPRFRQEAAVGTWIFRIASNHCLRQVQKTQHQIMLPIERLPDPPDTDTVHLEGPTQYLYQCIAALPQLERLIISLELEDVPQADIAIIVGIRPTNVRVKIHRIKKKLQQKFKHYEQ